VNIGLVAFGDINADNPFIFWLFWEKKAFYLNIIFGLDQGER